jgi:hypothetical protein
LPSWRAANSSSRRIWPKPCSCAARYQAADGALTAPATPCSPRPA